jgi:putative transposase
LSSAKASQVHLSLGHLTVDLVFVVARKAVRTDPRPEFTSRALAPWAYASGDTAKSREAGTPTRNSYIESFNGELRDGGLANGRPTRAPTRAVVAVWRQDDNEPKPHSALNYLAPSTLAANPAATAHAPAVHQALV